MTPRPSRPSEWGELGQHEQRIRILEAVVPSAGGAGSTTICTGCYEIDPEFADCVDLVGGSCLAVPETVIAQGTLLPGALAGTEFQVGPYLCNYQAGFRLQARYTGLFGEGSSNLWAGVAYDSGTPGFLGWELLLAAIHDPAAPVDTGWVTLATDPTGSGALGDPWQLWLGVNNTSILFDGQVGIGEWCFRYVSVNDVTILPTPQMEGSMLVAVGTPPVWVELDPGTAGQVLTMSGGFPTWV